MAVPIVIATGNPHKVREIRAILAGVGADAIGLDDLDARFDEPDEVGDTFKLNSLIKAVSYAFQTGRICLADDSGIEVDFLEGAPGVISSHYCTDGEERGMTREERDKANNERLLAELEGVEPEHRTARFVCEMVLVSPSREVTEAAGFFASLPLHDIHDSDEPVPIARARGTFEGRIGLPGPPGSNGVPRGDHGFGYDPVFLVAPEYKFTSAELSPVEKNARSHRGAAARLMAERIAKMRE
jgi:XTP/dITP diphosphohydrolase